VRRSLQLSLFAVVLLGLVGGCVAYFVAQKSVTLDVDGTARHVRTYADTVAEVLAEEGLKPAAHDVVLPAAGTRIGDGATVVLNRARPIKLTVDGVQSQVYVTALSVDEALDQLGYRADNLVLSASRSERLPLDGMALSISTPKQITLVVDGAQRMVTTTAATAGDLLAEQHITLGQTDRSSLYPAQALLDKMRLQVYRVLVKEITETTAIPPKRVETQDPNLPKGTEKVTQPGVPGEQLTTYRVTVTDGVETAREQLSSKVTKPAGELHVTVGTKVAPVPPVSADGLNWTALAKCESGGNPRAVNPAGYYGLYQFSLSTWRGVGGSGNPIDASPAEQLARAQALYARSGAGQWGCGRHLYDK
jgi:uncharacterized protein YabE (DUF348 family)